LTAEKHLIIDYNIHKDNLAQAEKLTPGMTAPTIMSLEQKDWFAVRSVILRGQMYAIIEGLKHIGAEAILVTQMEYFQK
jgi:ATP phosphoribosyltransferase